MSRRAGADTAGFAMPLLIIFGSLASVPAAAQSQRTATAEQVIEAARDAYGPPPPEPACAPQKGDEIVVCAKEEDNSQYRVKSSTELDPESDEALADGLPRAPDVSGPGIFKGPATVGNLCIPGLQKCPPPPALIIDLTALPEAPAGSDADKVGKGEMPGR